MPYLWQQSHDGMHSADFWQFRLDITHVFHNFSHMWVLNFSIASALAHYLATWTFAVL